MGPLTGFIGFEVVTTSALLQNLEILSRGKQEKSYITRTSKHQRELQYKLWADGEPKALAGFKCWKAAVSFFCEKVSEVFTEISVVSPKGPTFLEKQVKVTCGAKQPRIFHFCLTEMQ